jgi:alpha-tubulin suppressor-like RCC1 family protein
LPENYHGSWKELYLRINVYAFGDNYRGQLGLGDNQDRYFPTMVPNIKASQVAAGLNHSLILDLKGNGSDPSSGRVSDPSSGRVYAFGDNSRGQLGLGDYQNRNVPA